MLQNLFHRTIEWPGLKRSIMIIDFQRPCYVQGHQPLDQAAQSHIQAGLECLWGHFILFCFVFLTPNMNEKSLAGSCEVNYCGVSTQLSFKCHFPEHLLLTTLHATPSSIYRGAWLCSPKPLPAKQ